MGEDWVRRQLDYERKRQELIDFLESKDNAIMALATCDGDRVLTRTILTVGSGLDIYFFTWGPSRKCAQIRKNPRVALCKDSVQIEGVAEILGGLFDEANREYTNLLRSKFPEAIEHWKDRPGMVLVRVTPTAAVVGGSAGQEPQLEFLDLEGKTAYAERWAYHE